MYINSCKQFSFNLLNIEYKHTVSLYLIWPPLQFTYTIAVFLGPQSTIQRNKKLFRIRKHQKPSVMFTFAIFELQTIWKERFSFKKQVALGQSLFQLFVYNEWWNGTYLACGWTLTHLMWMNCGHNLIYQIRGFVKEPSFDKSPQNEICSAYVYVKSKTVAKVAYIFLSGGHTTHNE